MKRVHGGIQRRNSMALHREENKVPLRQSPKCKWIIARVVIGSEIATTKGDVTASWRTDIWGVDGAFASMTWRRHCVRDGVAPSANELAWFYMGSDSVTRKAFPMRKAKLRSVELPMKENIYYYLLWKHLLFLWKPLYIYFISRFFDE